MLTFNIAVYVLALLACFTCMVMLFRMYLRTGFRLLLWSTVCFVGLTINNMLLIFDLVIFPTEVDLRPWRLAAALIGLGFMLYGFIFESE